MYKSKLQMLCLKNSWKLPVYESVRYGPDHQPRFKATVNVNDHIFESSMECASKLKEAHNLAAEMAFNHLSNLHDAPQQPITLIEGYAYLANIIQEMYKSRLQILCQKKSWNLPVYETIREGPDHRARFKATVSVNGEIFECPVECTSSKEAQNIAAQAAYRHFSALLDAPQKLISPGSPIQGNAASGSLASTADMVGSLASTANMDTEAAKSGKVEQSRQNDLLLSEIPTRTGEDLLHTYKNRLQIYAQKRNMMLPAYSCEIVGPPHHRLYKSKVTIDGKSFETPKFVSTLKDAEHGAAKVAFESISHHLTQEDEVVYKTLLQEHAQRKGDQLPTYDTQKSGPPHRPIFISTVEIGGTSFQGQEAKTKKMAEMNAAKAAYISLTKCQDTQSSNPSVVEISDVSCFNLQPDVTGEVEEDVAKKSNISSEAAAQEIQDNNDESHNISATSEDAHNGDQGSSTAKSPPQDPKVGAPLPTLDIVIPPAQNSAKRLLICPRTPDMIIPEGATIVPVNNDRWVAMTIDVPIEEYEKDKYDE